MTAEPPAPALETGCRYADAAYVALHRRFEALVDKGAGQSERVAFLSSVFTARNREIRNQDFQKLKPASVAEDYLRPRRDLWFFLLDNWIRHIFLPSLRPELLEGMLVFGIGRIFSSYNDTGVQRSSDADLNIVVADSMTAARRAELAKALQGLKLALHEHFRLRLELNEAFTLLRQKEVLARLSSRDPEVRLANLLFYKGNSRSLWIMKEEASIQEAIFAPVRQLPDALLFENFLGLANPKATFVKLLADRAPLQVLADGSCEPFEVASLIGSRAFSLRWQRLMPKSLHVAPPDWYFSMKHFVNRVHDYVAAMEDLGYSLAQIGFDASPEGEEDPDYRYLRNAHRMMLYLQELEEVMMGSFNAEADYSYVSRDRFMRFMEIKGEKFRRDFEEMVVGGDLLLHSGKSAFRALKRKIETKARDRFLTGRTPALGLLPAGLQYETVFRDKSDFKIRIPYSWSDLGWFAFDAVAARMSHIVLRRLVPPLASLGMPAGEHRRYLELAAGLPGEASS